MTRAAFLLSLVVPALTLSAERAPAPRIVVDLPGYCTPAAAIPANPKEFSLKTGTAFTGRLGAAFVEKSGSPVIDDVEVGSAADAAGLRTGDTVQSVDGKAVATVDQLRDMLRSKLADESIKLEVLRKGKPVALTAKLRAVSKPFAVNETRVILGVRFGTPQDAGLPLTFVTPGGPAEKAGLQNGDLLVKLNGLALNASTIFTDLLVDKKPGDRVELLVERKGERLEFRATLAVEAIAAPKGGRTSSPNWDDRLPTAWKMPTYKLAVLGIEYPDVKHNPKIKDKDWEASLFSRDTYKGNNATGQPVFGSMNDYYHELSHGTFRVDGKFIGWVPVSKKRLDYSTGYGTSQREKTALLAEALDKYLAKNGKDSLKEYDGIFFLFAGERVATSTRGSLYWPHRATLTHEGKRWPYFIVQEGGPRMTDISVFCHEFGHLLGLPDLYARPENPGSEGVGVWCAMANQITNGRPQHFSAWSKEQLGWAKPVILDPRVKQKIVLAPIETDPTQCVKVMVRADGSEYFLLENRRRQGWDALLPGEGLLIWRVVNNRPILEESHGVEGPSGPRTYLPSVPYPSLANDSFTPYTTPTSRGQLGGGLPVWITNIRKHADGRVTFHIGYEYQ